MKILKSSDNKIEVEGNSKLYAMYNEVNDLVIIASVPIKKAKVYFDIKTGFDMVEVRK
jgi:hypothetical protein